MRFICQFGMGAVDHNIPFAVAAEAAGFDGIACGDSFMYPKHSDGKYPYTPDGDRSFIERIPFIESGILMSAWAAVTKKVSFYPSVYKFPSRHPVQVAKMMTSLAVLSDERLKFGIGLSPWEEDFTVFGLEFKSRVRRLVEGVEIMRGLMTGEYFGYNGRIYQFPEIKLNPVPKKPIPILLSGHAEPAMRRAAEIGDGWISANVSYNVLKPLVTQIKRYRSEIGSSSRAYEIHVHDTDLVDVATARRTADLGATDAQVMPWMRQNPNANLQEKIDSIKRFGDEVIAKFR
jgi:alkanesulfonate monooxygenase SsuD/methylene tetrahydromethanopterin reductase-like flavin-dependent oxidoreductase (luciferase family)